MVKAQMTEICCIHECGFQQEASHSAHDTVGTAMNQALSLNLTLQFPMKQLWLEAPESIEKVSLKG
jgi:hypothetical protein